MIETLLRKYLPDVQIFRRSVYRYAELGGEIPETLVLSLVACGAEVRVYRHHGVTATVVRF